MLLIENCLCQVQEDRQIIIKEEGSKEDDRQGDDFFVAVKNVYVDLKLYHQKDEN